MQMANYSKKFISDFNSINDYYNFLVDKTKNKEYVGITNEWLIDNFYIVVEHKTNFIHDKKSIKKRSKMINSIYYTIRDIVLKYNYNVSLKILTEELKKYQKENNNYLSYLEIESIKDVLIFIYIDRLNQICKEESKKLVDKEKIVSIIRDRQDRGIDLSNFIKDDFVVENNYNFIFELNRELKSLGVKSNKIFKQLNEYLESKNVSLKQLINDEYQNKIENDILISNIFGDLKEFFEISREDLFEKISRTEKILLDDDIYAAMTPESKDLYRERLLKLAKSKHCSELELLNKMIEDSDSTQYHIGFQLFKKKNNSLKVVLYIATIFIFTFVVSYFLSKYFIKWRVLGLIILLIPVSQLFVQVFNQLLMRFVRPKVLPKLDYSKGIPKESSTMVVIPTIVGNKEKIKEMFDVLETFYIINKTSNLYFTLLGDVKAADKEVCDFDAELSKYGREYAEKLNEKYKKDIFYFIYRKRIWNEGENQYLGFERKRGALIQFNKILLKQMDKVNEEKFFNVNMLHNHKLDIKYVITLDTDTRFVLNTILNLVGCMSHPLNKPILNKEGTKVVSGYGLMQPRVSVDIEATNKSLYSQIFAGIGGFDTYSAVVPNVYQDCFGEGSFVGKGIYDLKVFDKILANTFPDNLILSHDLLEGNYLRCGYVSDVEVVDDFPSKFLTDITRHHRWARGDVQIIDWLFGKVKNRAGKVVKNPINLLGKYKIFDNIVRMFLYPTLLLILLLPLVIGVTSPLWWIGFVILEIAVPVIFYLKSKMQTKQKDNTTVYYKHLFFGGKSLLARCYIVFCTIPFYTKLYMDAFFRTMYRLLISHKNLLNWITAEEVEKTVKGDLKSYFRNFVPNLIAVVLLVVYGIVFKNYYAYILAAGFMTAPFVLHFVSHDIDHDRIVLSDRKIEDIREVALSTWKYFEENLTEEYNYLIPDNYQENRDKKLDMRTSPTAIGFSLTSIVGAYEMEFIDKDKAIDLISKILDTVDGLEKWHGHLYNWYDIRTTHLLNNKFVSSVDSGNFVASLIVVREFLVQFDEDKLIKLCDKLINNSNFKKFYTKRNVFSIGFDDNEGKLSVYNYNKFASEARLLSYLAICLGDVPSKHWFCLDKSLTTYKGRKGLISWSGTSFEYYMPLLFMYEYPNTLLDESYQFARFCQKDYIESVSRNLPWGISESAYNELDNALNYKYKAFATPYLKAKEDKDNRIVLSPYASIMALELFPEDVYENMEKFKKMGMIGRYGFYESYDYDNKGVVEAFFAHHQGMILAGIVNYLKPDAIKNYFHQNVFIKTFNILLKEKVQVKTSIDMKMAKYKKYNYEKESIENDIRAFDYISYLPEVSVLSNQKYCLLMNDRGNSFSRYRTLQLNRYRRITEQDYGIFLYIKDKTNDRIWSNTYAPINEKPEKYEVVFASDRIKYTRNDGDITTKTEITVTKNHNAEIRKVTFKNNGSSVRKLELTTYTEPILSENMDDVSHRVFNSMFISTEYDTKTNSLIARRKSRGDANISSYMIHRLYVPYPKEEFSFETKRTLFIGRNNTSSNPRALFNKLSNFCGDNLEPVLSLRNSIELQPGESQSVYMIVGFGRSHEQILDIVNSYHDEASIENAFKVATLMTNINTKNLNVTGEAMRTYNIMLNYLYQTTRISTDGDRMDLLRRNALGQSGLWKFGISGDRPIILVEIKDISDMGFVNEILKAFEYYKNHSIFVDVVIINKESSQFNKIIKKEIDDEMYRMYTLNNFYHTPGSITVIDGDEFDDKEYLLLQVVPRLKFIIKDHQTLKEAVEELQSNNFISDYSKTKYEVNLLSSDHEKLDFDNGFGGFKNNGSEYVIYNRDTPTPWSNIIANKNFGTIITNNGCGFTYAYNSGEFKLSSWTNEMVCNDKSEGFKFNGRLFDPTKCTHGFGYSILESETEEKNTEITEFVALDENIKLYLMKLTNKENKKSTYDIDFWINPILGNFEEKTSRHILSEFMGDDNYLKLRNVYSINFGDVNVFMTSSLPINSAELNKMLVKSINTTVELDANEEKYLVFALGCGMSDKENIALMKKYMDVATVKKELKNVKEYWDKILGTVKVKTKDPSFDYMVNGWYLYQTLSSRIYAKSGFYQVSGAFGFRDQLQDSLNVSLIQPDIARRQILINAAHQFPEGDVFHWWHEKNRFGLRSKYKDDYLWLVYATLHYIDITKDTSILDEQVPYVTGDTLSDYESEKGMVFNYTDYTETLLEHCIKSLQLSMNSLGRHKIPLMGGGDWNDGMNKVGIKGKGESVWLGFFLYLIIDQFVKFMRRHYKNFDVTEYVDFNEKLKDNLNKKTWDGNHYLRAFFDNGDKLGSNENSECKIDLISQSFAILSGVAPKDRVQSSIESVEEKLVDDKARIIKLLTPAFHNSLNNPGYIMNYPRGIRENGGQYTHSVSWYLMALIKSGYGDRAYRYYQMINPVNRSLDKDAVLSYKVEPYVIAADIYSAKGREGRGGWTWYTGSAGWFYRVAIEEILGLKKHGESLKIVPNMPVAWDGFEMTYRYMDTDYHIKVIKDTKDEVLFDNKSLSNSTIELVNDGIDHQIIVYTR